EHAEAARARAPHRPQAAHAVGRRAAARRNRARAGERSPAPPGGRAHRQPRPSARARHHGHHRRRARARDHRRGGNPRSGAARALPPSARRARRRAARLRERPGGVLDPAAAARSDSRVMDVRMSRRIRAALRAGARSAAERPAVFLLAVVTMSAGLLVLGAYLLVVANLRSVLARAGEDLRLVAFTELRAPANDERGGALAGEMR